MNIYSNIDRGLRRFIIKYLIHLIEHLERFRNHKTYCH